MENIEVEQQMSSKPNYTQEEVSIALSELLVAGKIFAKCPKCKKYLGLFEFSNHNCSKCGHLTFGDIVFIYAKD